MDTQQRIELSVEDITMTLDAFLEQVMDDHEDDCSSLLDEDCYSIDSEMRRLKCNVHTLRWEMERIDMFHESESDGSVGSATWGSMETEKLATPISSKQTVDTSPLSTFSDDNDNDDDYSFPEQSNNDDATPVPAVIETDEEEEDEEEERSVRVDVNRQANSQSTRNHQRRLGRRKNTGIAPARKVLSRRLAQTLFDSVEERQQQQQDSSYRIDFKTAMVVSAAAAVALVDILSHS